MNTIKAYITRYSLTHGILEVEGEVSEIINDEFNYEPKKGYRFYYHKSLNE